MKAIQDGQELCRISLDATFYLRSAPTSADVRAAWGVYRSICPREHLRWAKNTKMHLWDEEVDLSREDSLEPYLVDQDRRLDHGVMVRSDQDGWVFIIRGVFPEDVGAEHCASVCRVLYPLDTDPEKVFCMTRRLADCLDFVSGHAGFSTVYDSFRKVSAFDQIYIWAKQFYGLDVEDLNQTLPLVLDAIKGANWLTMIGQELWERQAVSAKEGSFSQDISIHRQLKGTVIRAGDRPVMGDRNQREFPAAYAEVENSLWPLKLEYHPEFAGRFEQEHNTMEWFQRLKEPWAW